MPTATPPRVLVVQHEDACPPARFAGWLAEAGCVLDVRLAWREPLPDTLAEHSALLVLGGAMDAWDDEGHPHLVPIGALVRDAVERGVPTLGICLGHQVAALALGGAVDRNPQGRQIGLLPVGWLPGAADDPLFGAVPSAEPVRVVQWNRDVVSALPEGATALARAATGELQAARLAETVWGVQAHPEADAGIVAGWAGLDEQALARRGLTVDEAVELVRAAEPELARWWRPLAERLAELAARRPAPLGA